MLSGSHKRRSRSIRWDKWISGSGRMKKVCGFALFWIAIGMFIMMLLPNLVIGVILIIVFLVAGYRLFCCWQMELSGEQKMKEQNERKWNREKPRPAFCRSGFYFRVSSPKWNNMILIAARKIKRAQRVRTSGRMYKHTSSWNRLPSLLWRISHLISTFSVFFYESGLHCFQSELPFHK